MARGCGSAFGIFRGAGQERERRLMGKLSGLLKSLCGALPT